MAPPVATAPTGIRQAVQERTDVWSTHVPVGRGPREAAARLGLAGEDSQKSRAAMCNPGRICWAIRHVWTQLCSTLYASWIFSHRLVVEIPRRKLLLIIQLLLYIYGKRSG